jgi:hypothetical protein
VQDDYIFMCRHEKIISTLILGQQEQKYTKNNDSLWFKEFYCGLLTKLQWEDTGISATNMAS